MKKDELSRRSFIGNTSLMAAGAVAGSLTGTGYAAIADNIERIVKKGRINQSVSKWCYGKLSLDELCAVSKKMGIKAIDLLGPRD
ncbi:MAG: twin-arginine translocation signal domain-containing protein, partial [Planctomycetota bacterium]